MISHRTGWLRNWSGPGRERGDTNLATVIIVPAVMLVVWVTFQAVIYFLDRNLALDAARHGVNTGRLLPVDTEAARSAAMDYIRRTSLGWLSDVQVTASSDGQRITVTVTGVAGQLVPFATFRVSQTASGPIERLPS